MVGLYINSLMSCQISIEITSLTYQRNRSNKKTLSIDVNDFDVSFARGLSLEDGAATLTDFTGRIIGAALFSLLSEVREKLFRVLICGGGRKNKSLLDSI